MTEDNKPLYDIESLWETEFNVPGRIIKSRHKEYPDLYRLIDFERQLYLFSDYKRVDPTNIIDINKNIGAKRKCELTEKALGLINQMKPIIMPYKPEEIKTYVEDLDSYVGFLYFRSSEDPDNLIPIKRYFRVVHDPVINFIEVCPDEFRDFKEST